MLTQQPTVYGIAADDAERRVKSRHDRHRRPELVAANERPYPAQPRTRGRVEELLGRLVAVLSLGVR